MITRDSDLVDGIPGGQEVGLPTSKQNADAVASASSEEVLIHSWCCNLMFPLCLRKAFNFK